MEHQGACMKSPNEQEVFCGACGYDLRGHGGEYRRCPECGAMTQASAGHRRPPLRRVWANAALMSAVVGVVVMVGFRIVLASNGLRVYDLWNRATPLGGPPKAGAAGFVAPGSWLAGLCFYLGAAGLIYCLAVVSCAAWRRDGRSAALAVVAAICTVVYGLLAFQLGLVIAGV